jgi:hypothetical protein
MKENAEKTSKPVLYLMHKHGYVKYHKDKGVLVLLYSRLSAEQTISSVQQWIIDEGWNPSSGAAVLGQIQEALVANGFRPLQHKQKTDEGRGLVDQYGNGVIL